MRAADNPLHTCFAWVGTGAFTSRLHVDRFLSLSTLLGYSRDELAHADNSFATFQNEPPYVLTSGLVPLPTPFGHSDGEGIQRNKDFIVSATSRLVSGLLATRLTGRGSFPIFLSRRACSNEGWSVWLDTSTPSSPSTNSRKRSDAPAL